MAIEKFPDIYDLKILNRIIENPEMPLSEIGKYALIASAPSISKRKKKLFSSGIIKRLVALLNYENLGFKYPVTFPKNPYENHRHSKPILFLTSSIIL